MMSEGNVVSAPAEGYTKWMVTAASIPHHSLTSYLEWEAQQSTRHELVEGEVYGMTGGSTAHGAVGLTLLTLLKGHLKNSSCRVFWPDVKLKVGENVFYPDIEVSCTATDLASVQYIEFPVFIAEILSPATEDYDRGRKFDAYRRIEQLREYLLIDPEARTVELRRRKGMAQWEFIELTNQAQLRLDSVDFVCELATLFEDVPAAG